MKEFPYEVFPLEVAGHKERAVVVLETLREDGSRGDWMDMRFKPVIVHEYLMSMTIHRPGYPAPDSFPQH